MSDHGGQPQFQGWITFDVTDLTVSETGLEPQTIVQANQDFTLTATFDGSGPIWDWLEGLGAKYRVRFFAERIGYGSIDIPAKPTDEGPLGGGPYVVKHTVDANMLEEGLYRVGATVTFPQTAQSPSIPWAAGFFEGLVIEVIP